MNWGYVTGFFDADGSISYSRLNKSKMKTMQISFHNTELHILEGIKSFIFNEVGINGVITSKRKYEEHHKVGYTLKYSYLTKVSILDNYIDSIHPKKKHRLSKIKDLSEIVKRNGKYNNDDLIKFEKFEAEFYSVE